MTYLTGFAGGCGRGVWGGLGAKRLGPGGGGCGAGEGLGGWGVNEGGGRGRLY